MAVNGKKAQRMERGTLYIAAALLFVLLMGSVITLSVREDLASGERQLFSLVDYTSRLCDAYRMSSMASCTSGGRAGAALSAPESSQSRAKASWLRARLWGVSSVSAASWPISSAAAGQVSPRARNGSSGSPARNCSAACPVSCKQSR